MTLIKKASVFVTCLIAVAVIFQWCNVNNLYAANLVLTGDTQGIRITPSDENLFLLNNMLLGETAASAIEISNTDNYPFSLSVSITVVEPDEPPEYNLLDILDIAVFADGIEINNFPAKGGSHSLGRFIPGQTSQLDIQLKLDGENAGNEYQMQSVELQWIFEAVSEYRDSPEPTPQPGPNPRPRPRPSVVADTNEPIEEAVPEVVIIEDEPTPLGLPEITPVPEKDPTEDEPIIVDIPKDPVPLGNLELPKTGEISPLIYILGGLLVIGGSVILLVTSGKGKE